MTRVLLTGGSGFIAAHILEVLLKRGHSVVTTVRSTEKGDKILEAHRSHSNNTLSYTIVSDMSQPGAFDSAVVSSPPFEAVIHTASPYHFKANTEEAIKELITTAVSGTTGILEAVKAKAPTVKRVVITSSFAAIVDPKKPLSYKYTEADWDPITEKEARQNALSAYRASKTFAEKAAWDFVQREKPNFQLTTCNPPLVLGPIVHYLNSLDALNTSNLRIRDLITGAAKEKCPPTGNYLWVDVRDLAEAHVLAMEKDETAGKRFFITKGNFCNREIVGIIAQEFPEYKDGLPEGEALKSGDFPEGGPTGWDNTQSLDVLGVNYRPFKDCIVDTVRSLQPLLKA
jgi:nucleoside-diphosphate-sugar epimerase